MLAMSFESGTDASRGLATTWEVRDENRFDQAKIVLALGGGDNLGAVPVRMRCGLGNGAYRSYHAGPWGLAGPMACCCLR